MALLVLGGVAAMRVPVSYLPERSFPELRLELRLDAPSTLEATTRRYVQPLEAAIRAVGGVESMAGQVTPAGGMLRIRFHPGVDVEVKAARLESELAAYRRDLPRGARLELWPGRQGEETPAAIVWYRIEERVSERARDVERRLLDLPSVRGVEVGGIPRRELRVRPGSSAVSQAQLLAALDGELSKHRLGALEGAGRRTPVWLDEHRGEGATAIPVAVSDAVLPMAAVATIEPTASEPWWLARRQGRAGVVFFVSREHEASPLAFRRAVEQVLAADAGGDREAYEFLVDEAEPLHRLLHRAALGLLGAALAMAAVGGWLGGVRGAAVGLVALPLGSAAGFQGLWLARLGLDVATLPPFAIALAGALLAGSLPRSGRTRVWAWIAACSLPLAVALAGGDLGPMLAEPTRVFLVVLGAASLALGVLPRVALAAPGSRWLRRVLNTGLRGSATVALVFVTLVYGLFVVSGKTLTPRAGSLTMAALDLVVEVGFAEGGSLEQAERQIMTLENHLSTLDAIASHWTVLGRSMGRVGVTLAPGHRSHHQLVALVRRLEIELAGLGASVTVIPLASGAGATPPLRWSSSQEDRAEFDPKTAHQYKFILRSTDLAALRSAEESLTEVLRDADHWLFPRTVRTDWREPQIRLELVPKPGVPTELWQRALEAVSRRALWPVSRPLAGRDDLELRVLPQDGPRSVDDVPSRQEILGLRLPTTVVGSDLDTPLAVGELFDLVERVESTGIKRQSGRFVLPVSLTLRGMIRAHRMDGARAVNKRLSQPLPVGVEIERPSLSDWRIRREQWRMLGIASVFPCLLLAVAVCRLDGFWRALAALAAPVAGLASASPLVLAERGSIDEVTLLALAAILAPTLAVALEVASAVWRPRASLAGGFTRRWLESTAGPMTLALSGVLVLLLLPGLGLSADREPWVLPLRAAGLAGLGSMLTAFLVVPAWIGAGRAWKRRDRAEIRRRRRPPEWLEPGGLELGARRLAKVYGDGFTALSAVDFRLEPGIVGLLGPNGAGKTTLLRLLCGLLEPSRGQVIYRGVPVTPDNLAEYRKLVGFLPQEFNAYEGMAAAHFLDYWALERGMIQRRQRRDEVERVLDLVGLSDVAGRKVRQFSGGMRRRIGIARALLGDPPIVIVDEPTTGLDVESRNRLRESLLAVAGERVIVFSTHIASDIAAAATRVLLLHQGRLLYDGAARELIERAEGRVFETVLSDADLREFSHRYRVSTRVRVRDGIRVRAVTLGDDEPAGEVVIPNLEEAYLATLGEVEERRRRDAQPKTAAARLLDVASWRS